MEQHPLCPRFEKAMRMLGKPWTILILERLMIGPRRFGEIEAELPVSGRLLSERLKELEREGLVERTVYPETPVRIVYAATSLGAALEPALAEIGRWAEQWGSLEQQRKGEEDGEEVKGTDHD